MEAKCEMCFGGVATAFCRHCMDFIYAECVKLHQRLKVFASHEISTLKEGGARNIVAKPQCARSMRNKPRSTATTARPSSAETVSSMKTTRAMNMSL